MNPIALTHLLVGLMTVAVSLPLVKRKIKMNRWYGIRIPAAFESEQRWFEINAYGGRLLLRGGSLIALAAVPEFFLSKPYWVAGALAGAVVMTLTLGLSLPMIFRHARAMKKS
ncbi:MAG TPA: SdpI family protein [Opitutaceae bacterium]|nr:SdpI family protein [Opitutaceae bacterium]